MNRYACCRGREKSWSGSWCRQKTQGLQMMIITAIPGWLSLRSISSVSFLTVSCLCGVSLITPWLPNLCAMPPMTSLPGAAQPRGDPSVAPSVCRCWSVGRQLHKTWHVYPSKCRWVNVWELFFKRLARKGHSWWTAKFFDMDV